MAYAYAGCCVIFYIVAALLGVCSSSSHVPHPCMMHMLGRGQRARQCSMRSDARVSGEFVVKGLVGERIAVHGVSVTQ